MEQQQDIGGAQALLQLGTKTKSDDEQDGDNVDNVGGVNVDGVNVDGVNVAGDNVDGDNLGGEQGLGDQQNIKYDKEDEEEPVGGSHGVNDVGESDDEMAGGKTTNQQINDAVEAAVMRYVGGTLDGNETQGGASGSGGGAAAGAAGASGGSSTGSSSRKNKRKITHDDIMSNINEFNQWTGFLDEDIADNHADFNSFAPNTSLQQQQLNSPKSLSKRKRRKVTSIPHTHNEIDPELTGIDSNAEHDQLVQAAIMDARELAKQLGNGSLQDNEQGASSSGISHHNLHNLPPHQAQQVLAAASAAVQNQGHANSESIAAINQLAQAASSLSNGYNRGNRNLKGPTKLSKIEDDLMNYRATKSAPEEMHKGKFNHLTSIDALVEEASNQACNWYNSLPHTNGDGPRLFSAEEIAAVDHFITGYCHLHKLTRQDICNRIWSNERKKDNFWESLTNVLPYRSRASVYKHVRRQYHVFEVRAKWTKEDDELLRKLASTKEGNWKEIGSTMGRMPEDCRDRWRNYVKCGDNRVLNKWSEEEERKLKDVVTEMLATAPDDKKTSAINWTVVSEKMNGIRSRIQCRYKWNKLVKRESAVRASYMDQNTRLWLFQRLQRLGFHTVESINWDYISHLYHEEHNHHSQNNNNNNNDNNKNLRVNKTDHDPAQDWMAIDFKVGFEKMKAEVKDHRKMSLPEVLERLIDDLYIRQGQIPPRSQAQTNQKQPVASHQPVLPIHESHDTSHYGPPRPQSQQSHVQQEEDDDDATSIANAAVAAVSASVNQDDHQQDYSMWR